MGETIRIAAIQMCSGMAPGDNLDALTDMVAGAAELGAAYVLTPEMSVAFMADRAGLAAVAEPYAGNSALARVAETARRYGIFLHLGSLAIAGEDGHFRNRSVLFAPDGSEVAIYDKIHLFDADPPDDRPYRESATFVGGSKAVVADAAGFVLGFSICYDVRFPALYNVLAGAGAEVIAVPAAFTVSTGAAHWETLVRARAIETGSFVIAAAQGGRHENGRTTFGHSLIVDPWGHVLTAKGDDVPGVIVADIAPGAVPDTRARVPALANQRPFSLSVNRDPS